MWEFRFRLDRTSDEPLFLQIARSLTKEIERGRLRPGDPLPGTRTLARLAGVNRVTALAAYDELAAEGWLSIHPAKGTFVALDPPLPAGTMRAAAEGSAWKNASYELADGPAAVRWLPAERGVLAFRSSHPDTRLIKVEPFLRAYRSVLRRSRNMLLGYGDPEGHPRLRQAIARMLRERRALSLSAENVFVTRGSQMAIALAARAIVEPGDVVAVEQPGYRHAWAAFQQAGARLVGIPVDAMGLDVACLARLAARRRIAAVYVTPHHQLPTTVPLVESRRDALLQLARERRFVIVEDDYDHEFHYEGTPLTPIASIDPGVVMYVGTFSKVLAPALRVGYLAAPSAVIPRLVALRESLDLQGDAAMEAALALLVEDGELDRHIRRVKRIYEQRRDTLASALEKRLGDVVMFSPPAGGIGLWIHVDPAVDVTSWAEHARQHGVAFLTGRDFMIGRQATPHMRLGFASLNEQELIEAVNRMAAALPPHSSKRAESRLAARR